MFQGRALFQGENALKPFAGGLCPSFSEHFKRYMLSLLCALRGGMNPVYGIPPRQSFFLPERQEAELPPAHKSSGRNAPGLTSDINPGAFAFMWLFPLFRKCLWGETSFKRFSPRKSKSFSHCGFKDRATYIYPFHYATLLVDYPMPHNCKGRCLDSNLL